LYNIIIKLFDFWKKEESEGDTGAHTILENTEHVKEL